MLPTLHSDSDTEVDIRVDGSKECDSDESKFDDERQQNEQQVSECDLDPEETLSEDDDEDNDDDQNFRKNPRLIRMESQMETPFTELCIQEGDIPTELIPSNDFSKSFLEPNTDYLVRDQDLNTEAFGGSPNLLADSPMLPLSTTHFSPTLNKSTPTSRFSTKSINNNNNATCNISSTPVNRRHVASIKNRPLPEIPKNQTSTKDNFIRNQSNYLRNDSDSDDDDDKSSFIENFIPIPPKRHSLNKKSQIFRERAIMDLFQDDIIYENIDVIMNEVYNLDEIRASHPSRRESKDIDGRTVSPKLKKSPSRHLSLLGQNDRNRMKNAHRKTFSHRNHYSIDDNLTQSGQIKSIPNRNKATRKSYHNDSTALANTNNTETETLTSTTVKLANGYNLLGYNNLNNSNGQQNLHKKVNQAIDEVNNFNNDLLAHRQKILASCNQSLNPDLQEIEESIIEVAIGDEEEDDREEEPEVEAEQVDQENISEEDLNPSESSGVVSDHNSRSIQPSIQSSILSVNQRSGAIIPGIVQASINTLGTNDSMNYKEEQLQHLYKNTLTIRKLEQIKSHLGVTKDNNENGEQINMTKTSVNFKEAKNKQQKRARKKNRDKNNRQLLAYLLSF